MGCNFCTTSSFFGGKGKQIDFLPTGADLFEVMLEAEREMGMQCFFVMDENFLLNRPRALELLQLMKQESKSWEFYVFSSANAIRKYTMEELVELGISWIWMGLESGKSQYGKLKGTDTLNSRANSATTAYACSARPSWAWSTTPPTTSPNEIEYAVQHDTDFHQFMLYTPVPGTPLYQEVGEQGRLLDVDLADIHGQFKFNFKHARDFARRFQALPRLRFPARFPAQRSQPVPHCAHHVRGLEALPQSRRRPDSSPLRTRRPGACAPSTGALCGPWSGSVRKTNAALSERMRALQQDIERAFGPFASLSAGVLGPVLLWSVPGARNAGWRAARPTSRPPSSSGCTGPPNRAPEPRRSTMRRVHTKSPTAILSAPPALSARSIRAGA